MRLFEVDAGSKKLREGPTIRGQSLLEDHQGTLIRLELRGHKEGYAQRARVLNQTALDKLFMRSTPLISQRQWRAGRMWQSLYQRAGFSQLQAMDMERQRGGGGGDGSTAMQEARKEFNDKAKALGKLGESVLYWVVICGYTPREYGKAMGLYRTDGIGVLRLALTALADLYALPED